MKSSSRTLLKNIPSVRNSLLQVQNQTIRLKPRQYGFTTPYGGVRKLRPFPGLCRRQNASSLVQEQLETPSEPSAQNDHPQPLTTCPGCGALAQVVEPGEAGYYSKKRKAVDSFLRAFSVDEPPSKEQKEDKLVQDVIENADSELLELLERQGSAQPKPPPENATVEQPLCDRCHHLVYHSSGTPIHHPPIEAIQDTISESPWKYNRIYHVLDAADFPMSLVPNIHRLLDASEQRSRNRRSIGAKFKHGKRTEIEFIITRSDLLAPSKEKVDRLMPYLREVLRDALGSAGRDVRLGNVRCVSAKRGWWTKELKQDIRSHGGGCWMLGKVNVGKSNLFEAVFPKGNEPLINLDAMRSRAQTVIPMSDREPERDDNELLPPSRPETPYPTMPTVSALPGTTASPIRIPFGAGRGELIDLPGLARSNLDTYVRPDDKKTLVMTTRQSPLQHTIKPGQSLLLGGGLLRITPTDPTTVLLAYPFTPLPAHVTATPKAIALQSGARESGIRSLTHPSNPPALASAGTFPLAWDVTRARAGPLTRRDAVALKPAQLPFVVLSADILVESVGWVELVAQVRKSRAREEDSEMPRAPAVVPAVEVFSPEGKFVAVRRPMGAAALDAWGTGGGRKVGKRPRQSMASLRKSREGREAKRRREEKEAAVVE